MLGMILPARRAPGRGYASALAIAIALGTVASAIPAQAQQNRRQAETARPSYTPAFVKTYEPVSTVVNTEGGDLAAAKAQIPAVLAAVQSADDRHAAGNLVLMIGNKLSDKALQRQGLELMLASGKVAPEQVGQFQFFVGNLAYEAKDYAVARTALQAAQAAGYRDENLVGLLAEAHFSDNMVEQGLRVLKNEVDQRLAAGVQVPDAWLRRGLQIAYQADNAPLSNEWSGLLARTNPSPENWLAALQVVNAVNNMEPAVQLEMLRLMSTANSLTDRSEYVRYIEAADPRIRSNEVSRVMAAAVEKGVLSPSDSYYQEVKRVVDQRASADRNEAPKLVAEARRANANGRAAFNAGDVLYSLASYPEAEEMFKLALDKGSDIDRDQALVRLGSAQAQQGKYAEAKATFAQAGGAYAPVSQMWVAYADQRD